MTRRTLFGLGVVLIGPWLAFAVLLVADAPPSACTWACHDKGCPHPPMLPSMLAADDGLFGWTMEALWQLGRLLHPQKMVGYMIANLLVFVIGYPLSWATLIGVYTWLGRRP